MKKSAFILTIMLSALLSSMLKAQESTDYIYYPTHLWLNYKPQTINTPLINKGADIAGNTFSVKDFFDIIMLPDCNMSPAEGRKVTNTDNSLLWEVHHSTKSGDWNMILSPEERNDGNYAYTVLAGYLNSDKYQELEFKSESPFPYQLFVDGSMISFANDFAKNGEKNKSFVFDSPVKDSKRAELRYQLIGCSDRYFCLKIDLMTGRHHQIRAQLSHAGMPIRGDVKYGSKRALRDNSIMLHAGELTFEHPITKDKIELKARAGGDPLWRYFDV